MITTAQEAGAKAPPIHLSEADYDLIADLALRHQRQAPQVAELLMKEIDRATLHPGETLPGDVVTIGSEVEFEDEGNGERRRVRLVLPAEADIEAGKVSILTPIGAGLIGMRINSQIDWPYADGRCRRLTILDVEQSPA